MYPIHLLLALFLITTTSNVTATQLPTSTRTEISALFRKLIDSGCQFNRNGHWYSGTEAQSHLTKKLDYLERKSLLKTTEDFIKLAASESSYSGKAYLVKCSSAQAIESKIWLSDQLKILRESR